MAVDKFSSVFTNSHKRLRRVKSRQAGHWHQEVRTGALTAGLRVGVGGEGERRGAREGRSEGEQHEGGKQ